MQDHNNRFPLLGAHAAVPCEGCHQGAASGTFTGLSTQCVNCHVKDYQTATPLNHVVAKLPQTCENCHNVDVWQNARFDHAQVAGFALTGMHATLACTQCHLGNQFTGTPAVCFGCHAKDFTSALAPNHVAAGFPQDCAVCHTTASWAGATFNHNTFTTFALTGAHVSLGCNQCHAGGKFAGAPTACSGCHLADYGSTTNPNHRTSNFSLACDTCHTTASWQNARFDHSQSHFPLTGAHANLACTQCHINGIFAGTPTQCVGCHLSNYNKTTSPNHVTAGFPQDCSVCHNTTQWSGAQFNHAATGFALTGAHISLQCAQCHTNNNYSLTSAACWNCHQTEYNGATNPPHTAAGFPQDCTVCHGSSATDWSNATFNHATTGFALTGFHTTLQCAQCHVSNNYSLTSGACWNCHQTEYNNTTNPQHKSGNFPQDCSQCHTTTDWTGAMFNHTATGFALVGVHATIQCTQCHVNNNYSLTGAACWNCHQTDYNGATNPPHKSAGFPQDCTVCHGTTALDWTRATFNHATTGFALTGFHLTMQCAQCHVNSNYSLTSGACWNCHQTDYNGTTNPPHLTSGFPQDCSQCHTTTDWTGATFNHAATGFALTGFHLTMQCAQCHVNNNFSLTSAACWNCHQTDYNGTTNPPHKSAGFPQDCSTCHSTTDWTGATFGHPAAPLALSGYHATMLANNQCALCHVNNNYTNTPSDCWSCHQTDYNNTTNPNHAASGFPQTCNLCHSFVDWTGAQYTAHDASYFPIYSGSHRGKWTSCGDCHTNAANYAVFSCIICHQHSNQASVTSDHGGVKGFVYNGTSCYTCHPTGRGGG